MAFLRLNGVSKYYGDLCVVADLDLAVEKGEFVSLLGPSGCGKTTTLQMIAGFADVTRGTVELDGRDITRAKPNTRGLGIVFQSYALFPHMTVADNVGFGLKMRRVGRSERDRRMKEALALVKLDQHATRYPRELSGGQRQRVALARALVISPPVLLLDEPLSNLDAQLREEMQYELRNIQRHVGTTTIMVTHDQAEALSISDRVVVMQNGRATQIDQPYRMYEHPQTEFISRFVGKTNLIAGEVIDIAPTPAMAVGHAAQAPATATASTSATVASTATSPADSNAAVIATATVRTSSLTFDVPAAGLARGDRVQISLRPEKLHLIAAGTGRLPATVALRFFLGSQWMYELDSAAGRIVVVVPNDGGAPHDVGMPIDLDWSPAVVRVLPPVSAASAV